MYFCICGPPNLYYVTVYGWTIPPRHFTKVASSSGFLHEYPCIMTHSDRLEARNNTNIMKQCVWMFILQYSKKEYSVLRMKGLRFKVIIKISYINISKWLYYFFNKSPSQSSFIYIKTQWINTEINNMRKKKQY